MYGQSQPYGGYQQQPMYAQQQPVYAQQQQQSTTKSRMGGMGGVLGGAALGTVGGLMLGSALADHDHDRGDTYIENNYYDDPNRGGYDGGYDDGGFGDGDF